MRPGVRSQELGVTAESLPQVRAQAVVNRAAVGEVGVHVAERDAVRQGCGVAPGIQPVTREKLLRESDTLCARRSLRGQNELGYRSVQPRRSEEIDQCGWNIRPAGADSASTNREGTRWGLAISEAADEILHH